MEWQAIVSAVAAVLGLITAIWTAAYTFGVLKTRVDDLHSEVIRARNRLDHYIDGGNVHPPKGVD